jgi:hypothetical protein
MNKNIAKNKITTQSDIDNKSHQAYAMELSRVSKSKQKCEENNDCGEFNERGGQERFTELSNAVKQERTKDELSRKIKSVTDPNSQFRDEKDPTSVGGTPRLDKKSDHDGSNKNKIMSNKQSMSENINKEISDIRYLIEYMNNNKKQKL